ncbi:late embryogenesis abundant protein [Leptospira fainei serovar Hurstbridge str. BUT 6]|uniref:Late embryogenesis abundant protein n=1 Tax=Leptospira fainei serovar Hurstbridge str. BUT 6 TaxID=1193011 RepID=S3UWE8_9LEPT|nr:LEA type 2 family protein [Leptospira fainei]EPG73563.1 late embryogenesis abundant protein [Leptospira fainei serovar Hurstbridge str. BUT 6]
MESLIRKNLLKYVAPISFKIIGAVLCLSLLGLSCLELRQNVKKLESCKFQVVDIKAEKVEFISFPPVPKISLLADLEIENPNDSAVTLYRFDLSVTALGQNGEETELARVVSNDETVVAPFSKKNIGLSIETRFEKRMNQNLLLIAAVLARDILSGKDPNMRIKGTVKYKSIFGEVDLPVDEKVKLQPKNKS